MARFLQLHLLAALPPSPHGWAMAAEPGTVVFGDHPRRRIPSRWLVRTWCASAVFNSTLAGHVSRPILELVPAMGCKLMAEGVPEPDAHAAAAAVMAAFRAAGAPDGDRAFVTPAEQPRALALARRVAAGETVGIAPAQVLRPADDAVDVALFGRALPGLPAFDRGAAVDVADALSTHRAVSDEAGGVYYLHLRIDRDRLRQNLAGDTALARAALGALALTVASTLAPSPATDTGAPAGYILAEAGPGQPRTLAGAFLEPMTGDDLMGRSIAALEAQRHRLAASHGEAPRAAVMDAHVGRGSLDEIVAFMTR